MGVRGRALAHAYGGRRPVGASALTTILELSRKHGRRCYRIVLVLVQAHIGVSLSISGVGLEVYLSAVSVSSTLKLGCTHVKGPK